MGEAVLFTYNNVHIDVDIAEALVEDVGSGEPRKFRASEQPHGHSFCVGKRIY